MREVSEHAWDALVGEEGSPFVEWTWLDCMEEAGCVGGDGEHAAAWVPAHLALFRTGGGEERLVAAAPAYLKDNSEGEFVFDWSWADLAHRMRTRYYPKLVVAVPFSPVTGERVLVAPGEDRAALVPVMAAAAREIAGELGAHSVHALFPRAEEAAGWTRAGYVERYGVQYHWHNHGYASFDDFVATFKSKKRTQLRRERAQAGKDGVTIETLAPEAITPEIVRAMYRFYRSTVDKFVWGRRYLTPRFFELVAERFRHRLAWVIAREGERPIAGAFNVQKGKRLYGRYWGATVEMPFLHFNVCYYEGIAHCIAHGLEAFEPGAGGEHKRVRGFVPTITHSAHWIANPRLFSAVSAHVAREREAIREHVESGGED